MSAVQQNSITDEVRRNLEVAVRTNRKLRNVKGARGLDEETDSSRRVLLALLEYAAINHMEAKFVSYNYESAGDEISDDEDDVSNAADVYLYTMRVSLKRAPSSVSRQLLSGSMVSDACRREIESKLASILPRAKRLSVALENVEADYDSPTESYNVVVLLKPPKAYEQANGGSRADGRKRAIEEAEKKRERAKEHVPSEEECLAFYENRQDTWALFGSNVKSLLHAGSKRSFDNCD